MCPVINDVFVVVFCCVPFMNACVPVHEGFGVWLHECLSDLMLTSHWHDTHSQDNHHKGVSCAHITSL